jgi:hypothetical protein
MSWCEGKSRSGGRPDRMLHETVVSVVVYCERRGGCRGWLC